MDFGNFASFIAVAGGLLVAALVAVLNYRYYRLTKARRGVDIRRFVTFAVVSMGLLIIISVVALIPAAPDSFFLGNGDVDADEAVRNLQQGDACPPSAFHDHIQDAKAGINFIYFSDLDSCEGKDSVTITYAIWNLDRNRGLVFQWDGLPLARSASNPLLPGASVIFKQEVPKSAVEPSFVCAIRYGPSLASDAPAVCFPVKQTEASRMRRW